MIDSRHRLENLSIDNYGDLLALAGIVRASGVCVACGPHRPHRPEHLWLMHDGVNPDASSEGLMCSRHALEARASMG